MKGDGLVVGVSFEVESGGLGGGYIERGFAENCLGKPRL